MIASSRAGVDVGFDLRERLVVGAGHQGAGGRGLGVGVGHEGPITSLMRRSIGAYSRPLAIQSA
jgi:hypothetical protein